MTGTRIQGLDPLKKRFGVRLFTGCTERPLKEHLYEQMLTAASAPNLMVTIGRIMKRNRHRSRVLLNSQLERNAMCA